VNEIVVNIKGRNLSANMKLSKMEYDNRSSDLQQNECRLHPCISSRNGMFLSILYPLNSAEEIKVSAFSKLL